MRSLADEHRDSQVRYLCRRDVVQACGQVDVVAVVADALRAHEAGLAHVVNEAYLGWQSTSGAASRCLAMPGVLSARGAQVAGLKVISGSLGNAARGVPRAQGLTMLFDPETAHPTVVMEAAYISAMRTAALTVVTARLLGRMDLRTAALIGCGTIAKAHLALLPDALPTIGQLRVYDRDAQRAEALVVRGLDIAVAADARQCVSGADLVILATTEIVGYLRHDWLAPGALVVHVSLDDVTPEVVHRADLLLVDDWPLVRGDGHRLLGRMFRQGALLEPDGGHHPGCVPDGNARRVDGTIGGVLTGRVPGRQTDADIVLSNPFGMSILDIAVADQVRAVARAQNLGILLDV